jgi:hypothetical protein
MAHQVCVKLNLLRPLAPSKVAVEAIDLHPAQPELQRKKQQAKNVHLVKSAHLVKNVKNVPHAITMAIVMATTATIVAIAMTATTATDEIAVAAIAMTATAMAATTAITVAEIAIMT